MTEKDVKKKIKVVLDTYNFSDLWYFMPMMNGMGRAGIPDFIGVYKGHMFSIEAKADEKSKFRPRQKLEMQGITNAGGHPFVIHSGNVEYVKQYILGLDDL